MTLIGIIIGTVFIVAGIIAQGQLMDYYDLASVYITLGGTIASTIINYSFDDFKKVFKITKIAFMNHDYDLNKTIDEIIDLAVLARRNGLLYLDNVAEEVNNPFLKKGIMLIVDGTDPELVREILETELVYIEERHKVGHSMFESMASYAPAYGMIGTLIGLISMLKNLHDASALGAGMATALITTFYGVILANLIFLPIAGKLKNITQQEINYNVLIIEGLLAIQAGKNPRLIEEQLMAFVANNKDQKHVERGFQRGESVEKA